MRAVPILLAVLAASALLAALPAAGRAQSSGEGAWRDSLRTRQRLGGGSYLDSGRAAQPAAGEASDVALPGLAVEQVRLQEVLAQHLLRDEESARRVNLVAIDSLLAVDLYQLRGTEAPHVYPASDLWIYVWRGRGRFLRESGQTTYGPGEFLQIPAGTAFALENESGAPTVALLWQRPPIDEALTRSLPPTAAGEAPLWEALRSAPGGAELGRQP
jgi:mannose-6-phosphate isomerase-like protein (cupin superfamily)